MRKTPQGLISGCIVLALCSISSGAPFAVGPYLGRTPPGSTAQVFAPGLICHTGTGQRRWEAFGSFSADGNTFCFQRFSGVYITENTGKGWTKPKLIRSIPTNVYAPWSACMSPDSNSIFFTRGLLEPLSKRNIYRCDRIVHGWTAPQAIGPPLSSPAKELTCSIAANNSIYFGSTREGLEKPWGRSFIWAAPFVNNAWPRATYISLNDLQEGGAGGPGIAPDESFMVFTALNLAEGYGHRDLYLTQRLPDGTWSKHRNLGPRINTSYIEHSPMISPDKKHLFFTRCNGWDPRINSVNSDIYWVELKEYLPESYR